jgi:hypothetical protein
MSKGGRRRGAGRPVGAKTAKHQPRIDPEVATVDPETGLLSDLMPVEWMLAVLRDPQSEPSRRDRMAESAAPYCHPRLQASITTQGNGRDYSGGDVTFVQILSVPHRGRISDDGMVVVDGEVVTELPNVEPYTGTAMLTDQSQPAPIEPPLPVHEVDTSNVTPVRRRDEVPD